MWSGLFPDFQYGYMSSQTMANLLTVVSNKIARVFNRSRATWAVEMDTSKAFDRVQDAALLPKLKSEGFSEQVFSLTWS